MDEIPHAFREAGLSPPTRGNPDRVRVRLPEAGSIPAHAGEPACSNQYRILSRVYPRPRGGTLRQLDDG